MIHCERFKRLVPEEEQPPQHKVRIEWDETLDHAQWLPDLDCDRSWVKSVQEIQH